MKKNRRLRMVKTQLIINRRKRIIKYVWHNQQSNKLYLQEGRLRKYNFVCGCRMCKWEKCKEKLEHKVKYKWYYENRDID